MLWGLLRIYDPNSGHYRHLIDFLYMFELIECKSQSIEIKEKFINNNVADIFYFLRR